MIVIYKLNIEFDSGDAVPAKSLCHHQPLSYLVPSC